MASLQTAKRELRQLMRRILSEVSHDSASRQTQKVMNLLFSMPEYQAASRIGVYLSMKTGEIATAPIVHNAISQGKRVFVPYTYRTPSPLPGQPSSVMDMVALLSMEDHGLLKCNIWGIPTPSDDSIIARESCLREPRSEDSTERSSWKGLDLILVPGMAFDTDGRRLGHGKGFYDFFFQQYQESSRLNHAEGTEMPLLVGLALQEQVLLQPQTIPTEETDWRMDGLLVGDGRMLRIKTKKGPP